MMSQESLSLPCQLQKGPSHQAPIFIQFATGVFCLTLCLNLMFCCCTREDDPLPDDSLTVHPGGCLVDAVSLGEVSLAAMVSTAELAGYPQLATYLKYPIKLYKIAYRTNFRDTPVVVSGIISFPASGCIQVPVLAVGNGLIFADEDAPSQFRLPDNYTGFEFIASAGFVVLVPDMIGFGTSKDLLFPIHNYKYSAQTMIDLVLAGDEFIRDMKLCVNEKKYLVGYSQGGYSAMAALKMIEENPAPAFQIEAAAVGAGGFNLTNLLDDALEKNRYPAPSHLALLLTSYNEIYGWNRPLTDFFREPYAEKIPDLISGRYGRDEIDRQLACSFDSLLNPDFLRNLLQHNEPELMQALLENSVDEWAPKGRLMIYHSTKDEIIPFYDSQHTYDKMVSNGSTGVTLIATDEEGHVNAGIDFFKRVLLWIDSQKTAIP